MASLAGIVAGYSLVLIIVNLTKTSLAGMIVNPVISPLSVILIPAAVVVTTSFVVARKTREVINR